MPPPAHIAAKQAESDVLLAQQTEARRLEAIKGFTRHYAKYGCKKHGLKSCPPCLAEELIPFTLSEETVQASAADDSMAKLRLSFGGDHFGLEASCDIKAPLVEAPPALSKAQVAAQLKDFLMKGDLDTIMQYHIGSLKLVGFCPQLHLQINNHLHTIFGSQFIRSFLKGR
jgi:hypothetical protein